MVVAVPLFLHAVGCYAQAAIFLSDIKVRWRKLEQEEEETLCSIYYYSTDLRVLKCRHAFCFDCLETIHTNNDGKIPCPLDRKVDCREPQFLPKQKQFHGRIFNINVEGTAAPNFERLLSDLAKHRKITITQLRDVAELLNSHEFKCAISKVAGTVAGLTGSVLTIVGLALSLSGVGAAVGVPLAITGAAIGAAGGATTGISSVVEGVLQRNNIKAVEENLNMDRFKAEQIHILLRRATQCTEVAKIWNIDSALLFGAGRVIPGLAKFGVTTAAGVRMALGFSRAAATTGLHVAGLVLATAVIPLDLTQMIISSIRIHKKDPSKVVKDLTDMANRLEHKLRKYLIEQKCFQLIYTIDDHWAYIVIDNEKKVLLQERLQLGCTLDQLEEFGEVVESGEHEVPEEMKQRMQDEWYSYKDAEDI